MPAQDVQIVCDPNWSTGSIAKDLVQLFPEFSPRIHPWTTYIPFPDDVPLICFVSSTCIHWPFTRRKNALHICCHPHELRMHDLREHSSLFWGGVSQECCDTLCREIPGSDPKLVAASARKKRFKRRPRPGKKIAGFIGYPDIRDTQVTGSIKRPDWFLRVCELHRLTPLFSNHDYTYETMQDYYDRIDYLICPSAAEGGPLGPFEAALCGVPVISTKVGFWGECEMDGYFTDPSDPAINYAIQNAGILAEHQFRQMDRFCMESLAPLWRNALQHIVDASHTS